jgi:glutamine synthetase
MAEVARNRGKLQHAQLFQDAVEEAQAYHTLQTGDESSTGFAAAAAQRAAVTAATVNSMPRCRKCETCVNLASSGRRRCLLVRAFAAASAGHTGADFPLAVACPMLLSSCHDMSEGSADMCTFL